MLAVLLGGAAGVTSAQRASPVAVTHVAERRVEISIARADSMPSLSHDLRRGATIGAITGSVVGVLGIAAYVWVNTRAVCCEQSPGHVRAGDIITIGAASIVGGGLVGVVLGYNYHFNRPSTK